MTPRTIEQIAREAAEKFATKACWSTLNSAELNDLAIIILAAIKEAQGQDKARLDFCEAKNAFPEYDDNGFWKVRYAGKWFTGNTASQAIDAAMEGEGK